MSASSPNYDGTPLPSDREVVLEELETALEECVRKIDSGRVYEPEHEKVRQGWIKTLCTVAREYRLMLADLEDAAEVEERIDQLEERLELEA